MLVSLGGVKIFKGRYFQVELCSLLYIASWDIFSFCLRRFLYSF